MTPVDLAHATRLINHGPTVLVATQHGAQRDVMAAAWSMPVEFTPPRLAVVIDKSTLTRELVEASGRLVLSLPGHGLADACFTVGSVSGRDGDKFDRFGLATDRSPHFGLPLVRGCAAHLECRVIAEPHTQAAYDTFFVEVVAALADARVFAQGRWSFRDDNTDLHTLHHLGAGLFALPARTVQAHTLAARE